MSAYIVFIREREHDAAALGEYAKMAQDSLAGKEFKILSYYGATETLEGPEAKGAVVIEFPSAEAARSWYFSEAYKNARKKRFQGADYRTILIES